MAKRTAKKPTAGKPRRDGSGRGTGANAGRGGCTNPRNSRRGRRR